LPEYTPAPTTREHQLKRSLDIVRYGHDVLFDEHTKLQEAVIGIYKFQAIPSDPKLGKVYQYQIENQEVYQEHEMLLVSATATFLPVTNSFKNQLWKSELQVGSEYDTEYKDNNTSIATEPEEKTWKEKLGFGGKKKRVIDSNAPYQHAIPYLNESLSKIERLERFSEMQSYGIDLAEHSSYSGMMQYLKFHRNRFKFEIAPEIIRKHKQYVDMVLREEKQGMIQIASKIDAELYSSRNDENLS